MDPQTINAMYSFNENEISEFKAKQSIRQTVSQLMIHSVIHSVS